MFADDTMPRTTGRGRMLTAAAWVLLLSALWVWGYKLTDGASRPDTGGSAQGSPLARLAAGEQRPALPAAHDPLEGQPRPERLDFATLGLHEPVVGQGADPAGEADGAPPPAPGAGPVRWDGTGPVPGARGTARLEARSTAGPERRPVRGAKLYVGRSDGTVAEFTVSAVRTDPGGGPAGEGDGAAARDRAAPQYRAALRDRAALELRVCGSDGTGSAGAAARACAPERLVSAYLTGSRRG